MRATYENNHVFCGDAINFYEEWESPIVIISDGPYGINGYPGDSPSHEGLGEWYEPHIKKWSECATAQTTLWFWNTEVGWATVHPVLVGNGWRYVSCCIWDKGIGHIAGNTNTKTIRRLPVVTEVCAHYVKNPVFNVSGAEVGMKDWLRHEWKRTGLPFAKANDACGVVDAATRKYLTKCHLWYMPPADAFEMIANYANLHGRAEGRPYFSLDGERPIGKGEWAKLRSKFYCPMGLTNVWQSSQLRNGERLKNRQKAVHLNQKPLALIKQIIEMTSDAGDAVWDPFAGVCTVAVACGSLKRRSYSSEIRQDVYEIGLRRLKSHLDNVGQGTL